MLPRAVSPSRTGAASGMTSQRSEPERAAQQDSYSTLRLLSFALARPGPGQALMQRRTGPVRPFIPPWGRPSDRCADVPDRLRCQLLPVRRTVLLARPSSLAPRHGTGAPSRGSGQRARPLRPGGRASHPPLAPGLERHAVADARRSVTKLDGCATIDRSAPRPPVPPGASESRAGAAPTPETTPPPMRRSLG